MSRAAEREGRGSTGGGIVIRRVLFIAGAFLLAGAASLETFWGDVGTAAPPFVLALMICLAPIFLSEHPDPFEPAAFSGLYYGFGLAGSIATMLVSQRVELVLLRQLSSQAQLELVQTVGWSYVLGMSSYFVGYYLPWGRRFEAIFPRLEGIRWRNDRLRLVTIACFALFIPTYALFQSRLNMSITDLNSLSAGKEALRAADEDRNETWVIRGILLGLLPVLLFLTRALTSKRSLAHWAGIVSLIGGMSFLILRTGVRSFVGFFLLSCAVLVHYLRFRLRPALVLLFAFTAIGVMNFTGQLRQDPNEVAGARTRVIRLDQPIETLAEYDQDRGRIEGLAVVFDAFPAKKDYLLGYSWLGLLLAPVPRWAWPEKTEYTKWGDHAIVYQLTKAPIPVQYHGALYANFSWFGVVIGMVLWGMFQRGLYTWLQRSPRDPNVVLLYSCLLVLIAPSVLVVMNFLQFVLPLWVIVRLLDARFAASFHRAPVRGT